VVGRALQAARGTLPVSSVDQATAPPRSSSGPVASPRVRLQSAIDRLLASRGAVTVLEAGCGSLTNVKLGAGAYIVGLDVSAEQLQWNRSVQEKIQADLETCELPESAYDVIVCWDVLEHLSRPRAVIAKFFRAVKDGGIIILAFPNVLSLKGIAAKYTPFMVHRTVNRFIYGDRIHRPGYQVFPTYLRYEMAPAVLRRYAVANGFAVEFSSIHESGMQKKFRAKCGLVEGRWRVFRALVRLGSLGVIDPEGTDCVLVLRKAGAS
jgi:SAM-dependent methyltransferase